MGLGGEPRFRPGERSEYCNTNFCLLERVIERVTGRSLGQEFRERIFEPLELSNTMYPDEDDLSLPVPYIRGYDRTDHGWRECSLVFFGRGDGAIISNARDVSRFFRALFGGRLVPPQLLSEMKSIVADDPPPKHLYGMGLIAHELPCGTVWGHSGGGFGYKHLPFLFSDNDRFAIFMMNETYGFREETLPPEKRPEFGPETRALAYESRL
jgi:D-alanyl-D-alanine carboxypeptidase